MENEELVNNAKEIISKIHKKNIGMEIEIDALSDSDAEDLSKWSKQLEIFLINKNNPQLTHAIESLYPIQLGNRVRPNHIKRILEILESTK